VLPVRGLRELAVPRRRRPASRDDARGLSTGTSVGDGCSHGADVRIGMEKDGPAAWCEASPPKLWRGEQLGDRSRACGDAGWRPESLAGQCFGLGDRVAGVASERACRDHCCERSGGKKRCGTWQRRAASRRSGEVGREPPPPTRRWRDDKGCFAGNSRRCHAPDDRGPFAGRRKVQKGRTYAPPAILR